MFGILDEDFVYLDMILISHSYEELLFDDLSKEPNVYITDQEKSFKIDRDNGEEPFLEFKPLGSVFFNEDGYIINLNHKFKEFQAEVKSNRQVIAINLTLYLEEAIAKFEGLKSRFSQSEFHNKMYTWRSDAMFGRKSSLPEYNNIEYQTQLPNYTIEKIAPYFVFQKKIVEDSIKYLESFLPIKQKRAYNSSYHYKYFLFEKLEHIGDDREIQKAKMDFFNQLVSEKLISETDKKATIDLFNDQSNKEIKVRWKGSKEELYYLINTLNRFNIIKNTKRQNTRLISLAFCDSSGMDYQPQEFRALHDPTNKKKIDQIIAILKPASSNSRR